MNTRLLNKLKIKENMQGRILNVPPDKQELEKCLREKGYLSNATTEFDFVICFVQTEEQVVSCIPFVYDIKFDGLLWMVYPKKSSKIGSEITRDEGWKSLHDIGYQGVAMIAIDDVWSAFRFRSKSLIKSSKK